MIKRKNVFVLSAFVLVFFLLNWSYVQADSTVISGKLKNRNGDVHTVMGKAGNAVAVWSNTKANKTTYGRIYLVELNRVDTGSQGNGSWEAGEPQLLSKKGQRPSVTYIPTTDQYMITWDTGLAELADYAKDQPASKIQGCKYTPSYGNKSDTAPSIKITTFVNNKTAVIGPEVEYFHSDDGYDLCYLSYSEAEKPSITTPFLKNEGFNLTGSLKIGKLDASKNKFTVARVIAGFYLVLDAMVWNNYIYGSWIEFACGTSQQTFSGLFRICKFWTLSKWGAGSTQGIDLDGDAKLAAFNSDMGCLTNCCDNQNKYQIAKIKPGSTPTYHPVSNLPIMTANIGLLLKNIDWAPQDNAKESDSIVVFALTKGTVAYANVSTEGKPGKAHQIFKTKKDRVRDMDVISTQHEDEVIDLQDGDEFFLFYSEFTKKNKKKAVIKCTTFEVK